jgi:hypothetical protein
MYSRQPIPSNSLTARYQATASRANTLLIQIRYGSATPSRVGARSVYERTTPM